MRIWYRKISQSYWNQVLLSLLVILVNNSIYRICAITTRTIILALAQVKLLGQIMKIKRHKSNAIMRKSASVIAPQRAAKPLCSFLLCRSSTCRVLQQCFRLLSIFLLSLRSPKTFIILTTFTLYYDFNTNLQLMYLYHRISLWKGQSL